MRDEQEENKVRSPTRKSDVWATQIRLAIYRLGHPPTYNDHRSAPFLRALVVQQLPSLLGRRSRRRHL